MQVACNSFKSGSHIPAVCRRAIVVIAVQPNNSQKSVYVSTVVNNDVYNNKAKVMLCESALRDMNIGYTFGS